MHRRSASEELGSESKGGEFHEREEFKHQPDPAEPWRWGCPECEKTSFQRFITPQMETPRYECRGCHWYGPQTKLVDRKKERTQAQQRQSLWPTGEFFEEDTNQQAAPQAATTRGPDQTTLADGGATSQSVAQTPASELSEHDEPGPDEQSNGEPNSEEGRSSD